MSRASVRVILVVLMGSALLSACDQNNGGPQAVTETGTVSAAATLLLATRVGTAGDPSGGLVPVTPDSNDLIKLGQLLFFSKTLGGTFDSSCASCHHPDFAGGDGLSLPVGVNAVNPDFLGPGRLLDHSRDFDPLRDGGPNVPRNSLTILNTALYKSVFFYDGRVFVQPTTDGSSYIRTPDSGITLDPLAGDSLLEAQARFPVASPDEMRNFFHPELGSGESFRQLLVGRLRGEVDTDKLSVPGPERWLQRFRLAFNSPNATRESLITYPNIQKAIAAYQQSMTFVDTPWRDFTTGKQATLSEDSLKGAWLFMSPKDKGGLGCVACHSGNFFTDEKFHNVGFPQIGRGKRADGRDFGRWQVTKKEEDRYAFRTPGLINIETGAPYGHSGTFQTMDDLLVYHANPGKHYSQFDYSLRGLTQFIDGSKVYQNAYFFTEEAINSGNLSSQLLHRDLTASELVYLKSFLSDLTDKCLAKTKLKECLAPWTPQKSDDPDGNMMVRSFLPIPLDNGGGDYDSPPPAYPSSFDIAQLTLPGLTGFPDAESCSSSPTMKSNEGFFFTDRAQALGIAAVSSYDVSLWFSNYSYNIADVAQAGGVSSTYLDEDCWPDLVFVGGSSGGLKAYSNQQGLSFAPNDVFPYFIDERVTGVAFADIDGDFRREMFVGNLLSGAVKIMKMNSLGKYVQVAALPMTRNTYGFAFADYDRDGWTDVYMAHWDMEGLPGTAPSLWRNDLGERLLPVDGAAGTAVKYGINQNFHFSPGFADVDGDGWQDLLIAADFGSSMVLKNTNKDGWRFYTDVSDKAVITDENGMGSAIGDIDNDGRLDWFVTAIYNPSAMTDENWGANWGISGNRLYRNVSDSGQPKFENVSVSAGIIDGSWGWGACMADFNNDGWLDIFHVNGFGRQSVQGRNTIEQSILEFFDYLVGQIFGMNPPRLFLNNKDGTFSQSATEWNLTAPVDGKGITCLDYDRDGDIDIAVFENHGTMKLYENNTGSGSGRHFVSMRLTGRAPATEAIGAKVTVVADINANGVIDSGETQVRAVAANSNYNSQNSTDIHFGLGDASIIKTLRVEWPDGHVQEFANQAVDVFSIVAQP